MVAHRASGSLKFSRGVIANRSAGWSHYGLNATHSLRYIRWFTPYVLDRTEGLRLRTHALRAGAGSPRPAVCMGPGTYWRLGHRRRPTRLAGKFRARNGGAQ